MFLAIAGLVNFKLLQREDSLMMLYLSYKKLKNLKVEAQVELDAKAHQLRELESALVKNLKSLENAKSRLAMNESTEVSYSDIIFSCPNMYQTSMLTQLSLLTNNLHGNSGIILT
jgi:hypothetical protein